MESQNEAISLGDDDIVKSTQFHSGNCIGSQQTTPGQAQFPYASSQAGAYHQPQYVASSGMRPPEMHQNQAMQSSIHPSMSQIPFGPQKMWPNYGHAYGNAMHPLQHMLGSSMYSPFPSGNYNPVAPAYGVGHGGPPEAFLLSQSGHLTSVHHGLEWPRVHSNGAVVQEPHQRPVDSDRMSGAQFQFLRPPGTVSSPWINPRLPTANDEQVERRSGYEVQSTNGDNGPPGNRNIRNDNPVAELPSEVRQSPASDWEETLQGPVVSASVDDGKQRVQSSKDTVERSQSTTPSQSDVLMQQGMENSSKSIFSYSLEKRKAQREDDKSYLKEVKVAISQGRVPQVAVVQDDSGNIVRYRFQFLNALKLAAHAIVQDAYINVNEAETMNEIMKEVRRQFVLQKPLPLGMVEQYLKAYFKRCRSKYHQFWLKHGDSKKPDGCKQAAWLQLIEYWKSPEGNEECKRNKLNASAEKLKLKVKESCISENLEESDNVLRLKARSFGGERSAGSDPLGFDSYMGTPPVTPAPPVTYTPPVTPAAHALPMMANPKSVSSVTVSRNPMADISNKLHDAVDNILSSYAATSASLPHTTQKTGQGAETPEAVVCQSQKTGRTNIRTAAEVMSSLQRRQTGERKNEMSRTCSAKGEGQSCTPETENYKRSTEGAGVRVRQIPEIFGPRGSARDSSGRGNVHFRAAYREDAETSVKNVNTHSRMGEVKEETVELSSDGSSEEMDFAFFRKPRGSTVDKVQKTSNHTSTEEIGDFPRHLSASGSALGKQKADPITLKEKADVGNMRRPSHKTEQKQRKVLEEKKSVGSMAQEGTSEKIVKNLRSVSREDDGDLHNGGHGRSQEYNANSADMNDVSEGDSDEEPPVLPREIVKRKLACNFVGTSATKVAKEKGGSKSSKAAVKKQKDSQMDASVLKKLEFFKRPKNANPIKNRIRVWVLHPKFVGKVVAEAFAGINRKSRCVDSANEICKEGQQMISVVRVLYRNTPVMFDADSRFPKDISYLDQAEGLPNTPVLWCISHIIEIPTIDQITRMLGEFIQPAPAEAGNSDSDFEDSRAKRGSAKKGVVVSDSRKGRNAKMASTTSVGLKNSRTVSRSEKV